MSRYSRKKIKNQTGGKVLGQGRDGLVVDPPIMCSSKMSALNKVSKLINISNITEHAYQDFINEYKSGHIFRNGDPNNFHFLPGIDMCEFDDRNASIELKKDLKQGGYKKGNKITYLLNILMK